MRAVSDAPAESPFSAMPPQSGVLQEYRPPATAEAAIFPRQSGLDRSLAAASMVSDALTDGW
jgi:hypothetical protein